MLLDVAQGNAPTLDELPLPYARLTADHRLAWVNAAWRTQATGGRLPGGRCGLDGDYLAALAADGHPNAAALLADVAGAPQRHVVSGDRELHAAPVPDGTLVWWTDADPHGREDAGLREVFERMPVGIFRSTPDGRLLYVNETVTRMMGYPTKEALAKENIASLYVDPQDRDSWRARMEAEGVLLGHEVQVRRADGTVAWQRVSARREVDEQGRTRWYDGVLEDITERKASEDALRRFEALATGIFEALEEAIIVVSWPERLIVRVNRACERMYGYRAGELLGKSTEIFHVDREHYERFGRLLQERFARGEEAALEYVMRRSNGEVFPTEHASSLVRDADGRVLLGISVTRDISRRKRHEQELAKTREGLHRSEKLAALGSLVAGVAHEIRTPLAYIANHAYLAGSRIGENPPPELLRVRSHLDEIAEGVDRINRLVGELRRFTKLQEEPRAEHDLADLAREALGLFLATHPGGPQVVERLEPTGSLTVDRIQIQQVVLNLLQNAAEVSPRIHLSTGADGAQAWVEVEDEGPGVPQAARGLLFEPFYTTKADGMGLGLSIVRRIAEAHRGRASLIEPSAPGRGARFRLELPVAKGTAAPGKRVE